VICYVGSMPEDINDKPLTIKDVREVLIPAMEEVFATKRDLEKFATKQDLEAFEQRAMEVFATKQDLIDFVTKAEFTEFKEAVLSNQDKMLRNLDILMTEKTVSYYQKEKERKLWAIIDAMRAQDFITKTTEGDQGIRSFLIFSTGNEEKAIPVRWSFLLPAIT